MRRTSVSFMVSLQLQALGLHAQHVLYWMQSLRNDLRHPNWYRPRSSFAKCFSTLLFGVHNEQTACGNRIVLVTGALPQCVMYLANLLD